MRQQLEVLILTSADMETNPFDQDKIKAKLKKAVEDAMEDPGSVEAIELEWGEPI